MDNSPILITGATGFLGGFLASDLIQKGRKTILTVRPKGGDSGRRRIENLLRFLNTEPEHEPVIIEASIDTPGLGLTKEDLSILEDVTEVLHCAADTSFAARKKEQVETTNLQGLRNVFDVVPNCKRFFHMSSAYSVGKQEGLIREEMQTPPEFHNPYEKSKNEAEKLITDLCHHKGINLSIFRPSITYGDATTGKSLRFNALYFPVRTLLFLRDSLKKDLLEGSGKRAGSLGVFLSENGSMHLPVTLPGNGQLNLVPINFLVQAVTAIMDSQETGIFHIVNPKSDTVGQLVQNIEEHYSISGLKVSDETVQNGPLQTLMNSYMDVYYPYFCDKRTFSDSRTREILEPLGIECPELTPSVFNRCMDYAVEADWGSNIKL